MALSRIGLWDRTLSVLGKALELQMVRHGTISSNLANVETPKYQAADVRFEERLRSALDASRSQPMVRTHGSHLPVSFDGVGEIKPQLVFTTSPTIGMDLNSVDVDQESAKLAANATLYQSTSQVLSQMTRLIRFAIDEGGRV